jgi:predicted deacetylase
MHVVDTPLFWGRETGGVRAYLVAKRPQFECMAHIRHTLVVPSFDDFRDDGADGFIAPAWLLSAGTWEALMCSAFHYTTTMNRFYRLPKRDWVFSPSLVYSSRARWLYGASILRNSFLTGLLGTGPLLRLTLHPPDARDHVIAHWQPVLYQLLTTHSAMTKAEFVGLTDKFAVRRICAEK